MRHSLICLNFIPLHKYVILYTNIFPVSRRWSCVSFVMDIPPTIGFVITSLLCIRPYWSMNRSSCLNISKQPELSRNYCCSNLHQVINVSNHAWIIDRSSVVYQILCIRHWRRLRHSEISNANSCPSIADVTVHVYEPWYNNVNVGYFI